MAIMLSGVFCYGDEENTCACIFYFNGKKAREDYNKAVIDWLNHKDDTTDMPAEKVVAEQKKESKKVEASTSKKNGKGKRANETDGIYP